MRLKCCECPYIFDEEVSEWLLSCQGLEDLGDLLCENCTEKMFQELGERIPDDERKAHE